MAEDSKFWNTDGVGDGDDAGLTSLEMQEIFRALFAGHTSNLGGVRPDYLNECAVSGSSSPVSVASGLAVVYGLVYPNSSSVSVAIPTPSVNSRIDRIVLRADWTLQTVRVTRIAGSEAPVPAAPAMTQTPNTTWDIPLAQVLINTGGSITLTDEREWLTVLGDSGVSQSKIANSAVGTNQIADDAVTLAKLGTDVKIGPTVMYIPFILFSGNAGSGGGTVFASSSYIQVYPEIEITKEHFPSNATVKLVAFIGGGTTSLKNIDLYNKTTSAAITGSELSSSSATDPQQLKSSDFRANLTAGANRYAVRGKIAAGSLTAYAIYLLVEWS